jgi:hypothetical protein
MSNLQPAIDRARDDAIAKLFATLVANIETRVAPTAATDRFGDGLDAILQAHKIASDAANSVQPRRWGCRCANARE